MPYIPHIEDTRCCARCKSIPPICALRHQCPCHSESLARAQMTARKAALRHSVQDHWPEEAH